MWRLAAIIRDVQPSCITRACRNSSVDWVGYQKPILLNCFNHESNQRAFVPAGDILIQHASDAMVCFQSRVYGTHKIGEDTTYPYSLPGPLFLTGVIHNGKASIMPGFRHNTLMLPLAPAAASYLITQSICIRENQRRFRLWREVLPTTI